MRRRPRTRPLTRALARGGALGARRPYGRTRSRVLGRARFAAGRQHRGQVRGRACALARTCASVSAGSRRRQTQTARARRAGEHRVLGELCPLDAWPHLKRIRRPKPDEAIAGTAAPHLFVLLSPVAQWPDAAALVDALAARGVAVAHVAEVAVPRDSPVTAAQFEAGKLLWPISFHPPRPCVAPVPRSTLRCGPGAHMGPILRVCGRTGTPTPPPQGALRTCPRNLRPWSATSQL